MPFSPPVTEWPSAACPADPLQALRSATSAQHAALDAGLAIARPGASLSDYTAHAHALAAWLQALWPHLQMLAATNPGFDFTPSHRLAALASDLRDVPDAVPVSNHDLPAAGARAAWPPASATAAQCAAQALAEHPHQAMAVRWGFAYVVEGSQLGGQVMFRQLAERLAPHPLRYLQGEGAGTGARWREFVALLRAQVASPAAVQAACRGATAAFAGLNGLDRTAGEALP